MGDKANAITADLKVASANAAEVTDNVKKDLVGKVAETTDNLKVASANAKTITNQVAAMNVTARVTTVTDGVTDITRNVGQITQDIGRMTHAPTTVAAGASNLARVTVENLRRTLQLGPQSMIGLT